MKQIFSVLKVIILSVWIVFGLIEIIGAFEIMRQLIIPRFDEYKYMFIGFGVYLAVTLIFYLQQAFSKNETKNRNEFMKTLGFYDTLIHELSHLVFVFLTFSRPKEMTIFREPSKKQLGRMDYSYKLDRFGFVQSHLISLAPYYFPLLTIITWGFYLIVKPGEVNFFIRWFTIDPVFHGLFFLIGFSYAYHLCKTFREARPKQRDFKAVGYLYGLSFVFFMNSLFVLMILTTMTHHNGSMDILRALFF